TGQVGRGDHPHAVARSGQFQREGRGEHQPESAGVVEADTESRSERLEQSRQLGVGLADHHHTGRRGGGDRARARYGADCSASAPACSRSAQSCAIQSHCQLALLRKRTWPGLVSPFPPAVPPAPPAVPPVPPVPVMLAVPVRSSEMVTHQPMPPPPPPPQPAASPFAPLPPWRL